MKHRKQESIYAWIFLSPTILGLFFFVIGPLFVAVVISFTDWSLLGNPKWIGWANYTRLLHDALFWQSWRNTLYYTCLLLPLSMILGLAIAMLLNRKLFGMAFFRILFFLPMTIGVVASGLLWSWLFTPQYGLLNYLLDFIGLGPFRWLTDSASSMPSIIIVGIWRSLGFNIIVFLAGLQTLPTDIFEAASIDGANAWMKFRKITLPLLSPTIYFATLIGTIMSFQVFEQTYVMTQGGPGNSTLTIIYFIYQQGFSYLRMGYASAASVSFLLALTIFTVLYLRLQNRLVHYEN